MLENISLWYGYKTRVWLDQSSPQTNIVHNIMRTLRSIRANFNYVSTPITSGEVLYSNRYSNMQDVIAHNIYEGTKFADELKDINNILLPSDLTPTDYYKWEQDHFQALWLSVIAEKCINVYMNNGWEYSNGCSEELVHAFQLKLGIPKHKDLAFFNTKESYDESLNRMKNINVYDRNRNLITIDSAIDLMNNSISVLEKKNINQPKLKRARDLLVETNNLLKNV
jgi:hypothetical protein